MTGPRSGPRPGPDAEEGTRPGAGPLTGARPGVHSGAHTGALPGALPGALTGALTGAGPGAAADARLILRPEELDAALEQFFLAEAALWGAGERPLAAGSSGLGRSHFRAAFLLKRRPGVGAKEIARLTGQSKQAASRVLSDLIQAGYAQVARDDEDARRRPTELTEAGARFEASVAEALRAFLLAGFRDAGLDAVLGARRVLGALAGSRGARRPGDHG